MYTVDYQVGFYSLFHRLMIRNKFVDKIKLYYDICIKISKKVVRGNWFVIVISMISGILLQYHWGACSSSSLPAYVVLQWRHNEHHGVSNHQQLHCLFKRLFRSSNQRKHQSSASLAFVRGTHRWPVDSPHKGPVTRKMFQFDNVIMARTWTVCIVSTASVIDRYYLFLYSPVNIIESQCILRSDWTTLFKLVDGISQDPEPLKQLIMITMHYITWNHYRHTNTRLVSSHIQIL